MNHGPFNKLFLKKKRRNLGDANMIGPNFDAQGAGDNPDPSQDTTLPQYDAVPGENPDNAVDPRQGSTPTDMMANAQTQSTLKMTGVDAIQLVKFEKLYYPDEDCTQIEAIGINRAVPNPSPTPNLYPIFTMPPNMRGVIRYVGFDSNEFLDRFFTILISGVPVPGYGNFQGQIGTIQRPFDTFIVIRPQSTLVLSLLTVSSAGGNFLSFRFKGWYWPISAELPQTTVQEYGLVDPSEEGLI